MRTRHWLHFVPGALIVLTAITVRLAAGGNEAAGPAPAPAVTSSSSVPAPMATTATTAPDVAALQFEDATPVAPDLSAVDRQDPKAVASAWGCAYWAHPRGETAEALAHRLSPLASAEMSIAVGQLHVPDFGADIVEVYSGVTELTAKPNTYSVGCHTVTTGPDGAPTAPPAAVLPEVTVNFHGGHWVVSGATVGGLVLP